MSSSSINSSIEVSGTYTKKADLNANWLATKNAIAALEGSIGITQTSPSGSSAGPLSFNLITADYNQTTTGSSDPFYDKGAWQTWVAAFRVNLTVGGASLGGEPLGAGFFQAAHTSTTSAASDVIGLAGEAYSNASGTSLVLHGLVGAAIIGASANVSVMNGLFSENDINGGTVTQRRGVHVVNQGSGTATGSIDAVLDAASNNILGSFKKLFVINTSGGSVSPLQTTADFFWSDGSFTVANIFNLSNCTVSGSILNFPNVSLTGAGVLKLGGGSGSATSGYLVQASGASGNVASLVSMADSTTAFTGLDIGNSTNNLAVIANGASRTATVFGQSSGNWGEIVAYGAASNGLLLGTLVNKPIIVGVNNTEVGRWNQGLGVGTTSDPGTGLIYTNSASFMNRTKTSWNNGAAAQAATLTNGPTSGNPTKWIPVDDNGTTRYIPAW